MWVHKRRYKILIAAERKRIEAIRRAEAEKQRQIDQASSAF